jgi:hypothetical protein
MAKQNNDFGEGVMLITRGVSITAETLQRTLREYLSKSNTLNEETLGKTSLSKLIAASGDKLDNIKISDKNIGDFTDTARKHGVSFALKRDNNTEPPTWFVFFKQDKGSKDAMERAFREFAEQSAAETPIISQGDIRNLDIDMSHEKSEQSREQGYEQEEELEHDV